MSKIVLLSGWYYPYSAGGTEAYVHALARDLRTMGHDVRVAAPAVDESEQEYVHEGVEVYRYPISASPSLDEVQGTSPPEHLSTFRSWLESQAPDIVHTHSFSRGCGVFHLAAAKQLGIRTIVTVHTPDVVCGRGSLMRWGKIPCDGDYKPIRCTACCLQQRGLPQFAAWTVAAGSWRGVPKAMPNALRTALRYRHLLSAQHSRFQNALATADRVVAVSQWLYEMLTAAGVSAAKLRLNRQGLTDPTLFAQSASTRPRDRLRIAYVGRLHAVKGVDILIRGFRELPRSHEMELHIHGAPQDVDGQKYESTLRELAGTDPRITFHGGLSAQARGQAFASANLVAVPSVWFETGPLVVLEAFAAGLPVLGSNLGGISERVRHGESGWLTTAGDAKAWSVAIDQLYQRWKDAQWNWSVPRVRSSHEVAREMDQLYGELLSSDATAVASNAV